MQIEGTLVDAMFMKNLVAKKNNKFYLVDKNGDFLRTPGGKRRGPVTLHPAIEHAKLDQIPELAAASEFMADVLVLLRMACV